MYKRQDNYYESNNLQDLWLIGENFNKEDLDKVKNIENVKNAERLLSIRTDLENKKEKDVQLETIFIESNEISKMYFGKWCDMFAEYRNFYNFKTKRCLFEEKKEVSLMDL